MYIPAAFREERLAMLHTAIHQAGLATLVTTGAEGIDASHIPLLLDPDEGPHGTLYGHVARANPQWRDAAGAPALAIFTGPDAYVSPSAYPGKAAHGKVVPTWNYVAIHATGTLRAIEDPAALHALVTRLTRRHEAAQPAPWAVDDAPEAFVQAQLRGIVGLALSIERLEGKWKMSQNRDEADRAGVASALSASERPADREVAGLIRADYSAATASRPRSSEATASDTVCTSPKMV